MKRIPSRTGALLLVVAWLIAMPQTASAQANGCERTLRANVVALDQVFFWNRLGAVEPQGMIYALRRDIVPIDNSGGLSPGNVMLREDKRPRPMVLRMNVGDCLRVVFTNLLNPTPVDEEQPATRTASVHVAGMQLVTSINDDGSYVGRNAASLASPGQTRIYTFFAEREGTYIMYSGTPVGGEGNAGSISAGLFGAVNVQPRSAEWYRSQVTREDMDLATRDRTDQGHPILDYDAVYPLGHRHAGIPILKMLSGNQIVHSDLTAIITGPGRGNFPNGTYRDTPVNPDRNRPFREFTIIFHDEVGAVQAFPQFFDDPVLAHTTHSVRDAFPINYGSGGIGAEIIANRLGVGPMWDCTDCKYEEFFLTSWAVGDPAMVVDVPANAPCTRDPSRPSIPDVPPPASEPCDPTFGPKATKVFYPDDPSNVYHSYLNEHVKFRNLHAGSDDHHIFHLHAHQWVHTPDSDKSAYLDSQAVGQGSGFTYEITYNGSGNRNQTAGDSIFHCHFYPHFAQGMWSLWRVHDAFEVGTPLTDDGRPVAGTRALPDGEIADGTPIPGVVPLPTYAMAPMPEVQVSIDQGQVKIAGDGFAGYPFYIPGVAGHRPPHPPLDTIDDGGLPRHIIIGGDTFHIETRLDFTKELLKAEAFELPELGTDDEKTAMKFHAQRWHSSFFPDGSPGQFKSNGLGAVRGAPYADPCVDDFGNPVGGEIDPITGNAKPARLYKAADIEMDVVLNKKGWHFPQQRFISLWQDVKDFKFGTKPPEPLFFRANSQECIEYHLTNLVPHIYELDDFQVRTPTDILGQHIHLVKFDVTSSDGSANGFNYEDGTFSPGEVRERIEAINAGGGLVGLGGTRIHLEAEDHPYFGEFSPDEDGDGIPDWRGAQTTAQRWYADETLDNFGNDRTLRTVFTHDHFGPSTHQQAGLYAGLVIEPKGSKWFHNETGVPFYTRRDGGPTSWQAAIETEDPDESYREFMFEFADFQLAYEPNDKKPAPYNHETGRLPGEGFDDPANAVNPPGREDVIDQLPLLYLDPINANGCPIHDEGDDPGQVPTYVPPPCPEAVSADDPGMYSVNYRNEPLAFRLRDPDNVSCLTGPGPNGCQAKGKEGDPSYSYASITRADSELNVQPNFYDPLTKDIKDTDPWTPLIRAYEGDRVQFRILVGAHEHEHNFSINGIKWLYEPSEPNSGWRNSQGMGISEHFEIVVPDLPLSSSNSTHDFLYKPGSASEAQWTGLWGIIRAYRAQRTDVRELPNNSRTTEAPGGLGDFDGVCPQVAPKRKIGVVAVAASKALSNGRVTYNSRTDLVSNPVDGDSHSGPLHDPTAILFVREDDYDFQAGKVKASVPIEPLVLRANAGDCLEITLHNELPEEVPDLDGYSAFDNIVDYFNANEIRPSSRVGLHPQLLFYDVTRSDGVNVGLNPEQTAASGQSITYQWYAGHVERDPSTNTFKWKPIEFGATGLTSSDPLKHTNKGAIGALIIEPEHATWTEDPKMRAAATVTDPTAADEFNAQFREFVLTFQSDINMRYGDGSEIKPPPDGEDPAERGQKAFNYRAEPIWFRMGFQPETPFSVTRTFDFTKVLSNDTVGGDPETPVFTATPGKNTRFRVVNPGGHGQFSVFELHGHVWQEEPYVESSSKLGSNPLSEWKGSQPHHGPTNHFDALLENGAGGQFEVTGDYLYRDYVPWMFFHGLWGIFRVGPTDTPLEEAIPLEQP